MNSRNTWLWLSVAAVLIAFIFGYEKFARKPAVGPPRVLPGLKAADVTAVQVQPAGQVIRAELTNGVWQLTQPIVYPAQGPRIETLLSTFQNLTAATYLTPADLKDHPKASEEYGFNPPRASVTIEQGGFQPRIWIGATTPPGDQVFLEVVGTEGIYVVDAGLLKLIPENANDWRDTTLVNLDRLVFNELDVTNAGKVLQLQRNATNHIWRMLQPSDTRADSDQVEEWLQRLRTLHVYQFVSDNPKADLDSFGLQTPDLSMAFKQGTNTSLLLEFGNSLTNNPHLAYARRNGESTIVTVSRDAYEPWLASQSHDFRAFIDRHLLVLTEAPHAIEIHARDDFTLQHQTNDTWMVEPQDFPADTTLVNDLISNLSNMQGSEIVQDVVTAPSLPDYGLASPARKFIFKAATTNTAPNATNVAIAELDFGVNGTNVYARRGGEGFVYSVRPADFLSLPTESLQLRDRRIWNFTTDDVASITVRQNGKVLGMQRTGTNSWTVAPGSQGMIKNDLALDEVAYQLGQLAATAWIERGDTNRAQFGFGPEPYQISVNLKGGKKLTVQLAEAPSGLAFGIVEFNHEPWIFQFPSLLYYKYVFPYLTIPADSH